MRARGGASLLLGAAARRWRQLAVAAFALAAVASVRMATETPVPTTAQRETFAAAGRAYAAGRFREAADRYGVLVREGRGGAEVFFNLGNACAREGRVGGAVFAYREAWRLAPRDPDVAANLRLALQTTGAAEPDLSAAELTFTTLSEREWAGAASLGWWAGCLLVALAACFPMKRRRFLSLAALPAAVLLVSLFGLGVWRGLEREPELVVLEETQNALGAPLASASPRFPLPEGSLVRAREEQGEWVRVTSGQLSGWVRRAAFAPVLPGAAPK